MTESADHQIKFPLTPVVLGTCEDRLAEILTRTAEVILHRMYAEIPMCKMTETADSLKTITQAYLMLKSGYDHDS